MKRALTTILYLILFIGRAIAQDDLMVTSPGYPSAYFGLATSLNRNIGKATYALYQNTLTVVDSGIGVRWAKKIAFSDTLINLSDFNIDKSGFIYLAGRKPSTGSYDSAIVVKVSPTGQLRWARKIERANMFTTYSFDPLGNTYISTEAINPTVLIKIDSSGSVVASRLFNGYLNAYLPPAVNSENKIVVFFEESTGFGQGISELNPDLTVRKSVYIEEDTVAGVPQTRAYPNRIHSFGSHQYVFNSYKTDSAGVQIGHLAIVDLDSTKGYKFRIINGLRDNITGPSYPLAKTKGMVVNYSDGFAYNKFLLIDSLLEPMGVVSPSPSQTNFTLGPFNKSEGPWRISFAGYKIIPNSQSNIALLSYRSQNPEPCLFGAASLPTIQLSHLGVYPRTIASQHFPVTAEPYNCTILTLPTCTFSFCNPPQFNLGPNLQSCQDSITLTAPSLFNDQRITWNTGDTGRTIRVPSPGTYSATLTSVCGTYYDTIQVSRTPSLSISIRPRPLGACPDGRLAFGYSMPAGTDTTGLSLQWSMNGTPVAASRDTLYLTPRNPTNRDSLLSLTLTATLPNGCQGVDALAITLFPGYPNFLGPDITACRLDTVLSAPSFALAPAAEEPLVWKRPSGATVSTPFIRAQQPGVYSARFRARGCVYSDSLALRQAPASAAELGIRLPNGALVASGVQEIESPQTSFIRFYLTPAQAQPQFEVNGQPQPAQNDTLYYQTSGGEATLTLLARFTTQDGCSDSASRTLRLIDAELQIPNIVTLQSNGANSAFRTRPEVRIDQLHLYNRWGRQVLSASPYPQGSWPPAGINPGTYFYRLTARGREYKGWLDVVK